MSNGPDKLVGWRKGKGITQQAAAGLLRVSQAALSEYENGHKSPGVVVALRIAEVTANEVPVEAWAEAVSTGDAA
jgi:transcriptional regulator with XRE-family HTH domain